MTYLETTVGEYLKELGIHPDKGKAHEITYVKLKEIIEDFQFVKWIDGMKRTRKAKLFLDDPINHPHWNRTQYYGTK